VNELIRQAQIMQKKMLRTQEEVGKRVVEASAGGGMVQVAATCAGELQKITIDPSVLASGDAEMLQDLIISAVNEVLKKGKAELQTEMAKITGGMRIPGLL
jgi:DNA-binding YbaB/EbfC family protein